MNLKGSLCTWRAYISTLLSNCILLVKQHPNQLIHKTHHQGMHLSILLCSAPCGHTINSFLATRSSHKDLSLMHLFFINHHHLSFFLSFFLSFAVVTFDPDANSCFCFFFLTTLHLVVSFLLSHHSEDPWIIIIIKKKKWMVAILQNAQHQQQQQHQGRAEFCWPSSTWARSPLCCKTWSSSNNSAALLLMCPLPTTTTTTTMSQQRQQHVVWKRCKQRLISWFKKLTSSLRSGPPPPTTPPTTTTTPFHSSDHFVNVGFCLCQQQDVLN